MASRVQLDRCYMQCAEAHASLSKALRKKVGAVLVTPEGNLIPGVNGMPKELGNECEYKYYHPSLSDGEPWSHDPDGTPYWLATKKELIHAELNCILKAAKEGFSIEGSTLYLTLSPCVQCASMIMSAGIHCVIYKEEYRDTSGIDLLRRGGIFVSQYTE